MNNPVVTTHAGIDITLNEETNQWSFTVNGKTRSAKTLGNARQAIDKAFSDLAKNPKKHFRPIKVYHSDSFWSANFEVVTITSIVEDEWDVWISGSKGRKKVSINTCFELNEKNADIIRRLKQFDAASNKLQQLSQEYRRKLTTIPLNREEE